MTTELAERLYSQVFHNLTQRHADVTTLRRVAELGRTAATATLTAESYRLALSIQADPAFDKYFLDREGAVAHFGGPRAMGERLASKQVALFTDSVDAAALVFLHSAVDAAASDLCRVTILLAPEKWRRYVEAQRISLSEAQASPLEGLWRSKIEAHMTALERGSLRMRADRLFAICKPPPTFDPISGFKYDPDVLERLDELRQRIVHGSKGPTAIAQCGATLESLVKHGLYLFAMVNQAFGIQVNPLFVLGVEASGPTA